MKHYWYCVFGCNHRPGQLRPMSFQTETPHFPIAKATATIAEGLDVGIELVTVVNWQELTEEQFIELRSLDKREEEKKPSIIIP